MRGPNPGAGIKLLVHAQHEVPLVRDLGQAIPPGSYAYVGLQMIEVCVSCMFCMCTVVLLLVGLFICLPICSKLCIQTDLWSLSHLNIYVFTVPLTSFTHQPIHVHLSEFLSTHSPTTHPLIHSPIKPLIHLFTSTHLPMHSSNYPLSPIHTHQSLIHQSTHPPIHPSTKPHIHALR